MSHHGTIWTNKQFRKYFTNDEIKHMQLINIKGKPAKSLRGLKHNKDGTITVFGSDFVANVFIKRRINL